MLEILQSSNDAKTAAKECCENLIISALNSKKVLESLNKLPPYQRKHINHINEKDGTLNDLSNTKWIEYKEDLMRLYKSQKPMNETEFQHFIDYVLNETAFNIVSEVEFYFVQ